MDDLRSTVISPCGLYRYRLHRAIDPNFYQRAGHAVCFIMLNPSTADASQDDPTLSRCKTYAWLWGAEDLFVVNLFAIRGTDPGVIKTADDPVGPDNLGHIRRVIQLAARTGGPVVCAWGAHGAVSKGNGGTLGQDETVLALLRDNGVEPQCLRVTHGGYPSHPLYLPTDLKPLPYEKWRQTA